MTDFGIYIFQLSSLFSALLLVYYFFLRKLTFHHINRWILLSFIPISLVLPFLELGIISTPSHYAQDMGWWDNFQKETAYLEPGTTAAPSSANWFSIIGVIYVLGVLGYLLVLLWNVIKLFHLKRSSVLISKGINQVLKAPVNDVFSCFRWVFTPESSDYPANHPVLKHEEAHIKLHHTIDLVMAELLIAFLWFNPFAFLFRKLLKVTHEYQADQYVIRSGVKSSDYLSVMANHLFGQPLRFSSHFNGLTIKKRIEMISKNKSSKSQSLRYVLLLPICAVFLMATAAFTASKPSLFPIKEGLYKKISSGFGQRVNPFTKKKNLHGGIDIIAKTGTPVMATASGKVLKAQNEENWGKLIIIDHGDGYETWYAHLNSFTIEKGDKVKAGQQIGAVGNTGKSMGPHLHYEVRIKGKRVDPQLYFDN